MNFMQWFVCIQRTTESSFYAPSNPQQCLIPASKPLLGVRTLPERSGMENTSIGGGEGSRVSLFASLLSLIWMNSLNRIPDCVQLYLWCHQVVPKPMELSCGNGSNH